MPEPSGQNRDLILLTGATGYIGSHLLRKLEQEQRPVRCMVRRPEQMAGRTAPGIDVVKADVFDRDSLLRAMDAVHTAYYLVHSLGGPGSFAEKDRTAATNFARAAKEMNVTRIIYLGGLGAGREAPLSHHLASRQEVGEILRRTGVPVLEFRASIVIGAGSLSFEMVRALVEKLPVMTTPRWVRALAQPIAIENVISYLYAGLFVKPGTSRVFEIGGADRVSYEGLMREYARVRKLPRLIIRLPFLTPWLSSLWLALVTPLYFNVGRRLIEGVKNATVVNDDTAERLFAVNPMGFRQAIQRALSNEDRELAETRWSKVLPRPDIGQRRFKARSGLRFVDSRITRAACLPEQAFTPIRCIGGKTGWYSYNWLWRLRGILDRLLGGVGHHRGRRDPRCLRPGDTVDFWRVETLEDNRLLRLVAEMKLPGRAWLQFEVVPEKGGCVIYQTAVFDPRGIAGLAYWYGLSLFHGRIFDKMIEGIVGAIVLSPEQGVP